MMTNEEFEKLPLLVMGESKEIRDAGVIQGVHRCWIRFRPTIYSFTANRAGVVPGSDRLRYKATRRLVDVLRRAGIRHAYEFFENGFILSRWIQDAPNIETIVKAYHTGTSKHRYYGMDKYPVQDRCLWHGMKIENMGPYPHPIVRFDWRNPMIHPETGERLSDEILPDEMADWFICTKEARETALNTFRVLSDFLSDRNIVLYDLCLFISASYGELYGEISQDCGRFRHFDYGELDKDVWRAGGSHEEVLRKWELFNTMIGA